MWATCGLLLILAGAAPADPWRPLEFLVGEWRGEGSGGPGQGAGGFSFAWDLQKAVLVRKNHAEYPAQQGRQAAVHDDLMVISVDGGRLRADYWDNEGHVIRYAVGTPAPGVVVFLSGASASAPRYRLTYRKLGAGEVSIKFEIAPPGRPEAFKTYIEAGARRVSR